MNTPPTYHVARNGAVLGLYPMDKITEELRNGRLLPTDHIFDTPTQQWLPLSALGRPFFPPVGLFGRQQSIFPYSLISCIAGIAAGVILVGLVLLAGVMETVYPGCFQGEGLAVSILGLILLMLIPVQVAALVLGLVGLSRRNEKPIFGILGVVASSLTLLGVFGCMLAGR